MQLIRRLSTWALTGVLLGWFLAAPIVNWATHHPHFFEVD